MWNVGFGNQTVATWELFSVSKKSIDLNDGTNSKVYPMSHGVM